MNTTPGYLKQVSKTTRTVLLGLAVIFVSAGLAQAATTISTNIQTDGTLSVTGVSTFSNSSTTQSATIGGPLWIGGNATTTAAGAFSLNGALSGTSGTFSTTLNVTGLTTLGNASSTNFTAYKGFFGTSATSTLGADGSLTLVAGLTGTTGSFSSTLGVTGDTTLASTTATGMKVGHVGTRMTRIVSGYCVTGSITIPATNASSTQTYADCTPSGGASIVASGDRVFVQATSSLPYYVFIQAASSTAGGLINVSLVNTSTTTSPSAGIYSFNFWAFQ